MSQNRLRFIKYEPQSFAGIHKDMKLVVFFPDKENIITFSGDQGTTKTSNLACLKALLGGEETTNAINKIDNDKRAILDLEVNGNRYEIKFTRTGFSVTLIQEVDGKPVKSNISQPKTFLQQLIGPIASNPMPLKEMDGAKQIEWLRKIFPLSDQDIEKEKQAKETYSKKYKERTEINRDIKNKKQELLSTEYFRWDEDNKTLVSSDLLRADINLIKANNLDAINSMVQDASKKLSEFMAGQKKLETLSEQKKRIAEKIKALETEIIYYDEQLKETEQSISAGEIYIKERENAQTEWNDIQEKVRLSSEVSAKKERIQYASTRMEQYDRLEDEHIHVEAQMDYATTTIKEIMKQCTPEIEGLEMVIQTAIDSVDPREEGLYYKGHSMQELCESELWDMYMQICDKSGVKVIMIENVHNLGTDAIARINQLADNGATVFGSVMDRNIKNYTVSFHEKLK
jgi:predicted  nucleic acid-binding Zn-ribbon protein